MTSVLNKSSSKLPDTRDKESPKVIRVAVRSARSDEAGAAAGGALGNVEENAMLRRVLQRVEEELGPSQRVHPQTVDEIRYLLLSKVETLPTRVSHWDVKFDFDHDGDPAIYIMATAEDDDIEDEEVKCNKRIDSFSMIYDLAIEKVNPGIFVYVDLSAASEF